MVVHVLRMPLGGGVEAGIQCQQRQPANSSHPIGTVKIKCPPSAVIKRACSHGGDLKAGAIIVAGKQPDVIAAGLGIQDNYSFLKVGADGSLGVGGSGWMAAFSDSKTSIVLVRSCMRPFGKAWTTST